MNEVLIGTGNHKFNVFITVIEQLVVLVAVIICINLELGIYVLIIPGFFQTAVKQGFGWWFINKKIINLRINAWQNWIATFFAGCVYFGIFYGLLRLFTSVFENQIFTIILFLGLGIYILPGPCYFFPLGLFGGYDKNTLEDLHKATELAGPSKFMVKLWYWGAKFGSRKSPLFGRFPLDYSGDGEDIADLMEMKKASDAQQIHLD